MLITWQHRMEPVLALSRIAIFLSIVAGAGFAQDAPGEFFEKRIRPVLSAKCYACHNAATKLGGLQLTSRAALLAGGKSGPAITPGNSETSLLIRAITQSDPKLKMPMAGEKLTGQEIADFSSWVQAGAPWPETEAEPGGAKTGFHITPEQNAFWSLQPIVKPSLPLLKDAASARTAVDRFILAKLEQNGL